MFVNQRIYEEVLYERMSTESPKLDKQEGDIFLTLTIIWGVFLD